MEQREVAEKAPDPVEPAELVTERLEAEITTLAAHLTAAECRFLLLVGEFDRREAFLAWGCRTAAFWLSWKCGIDIRSAQVERAVRAYRGVLSREEEDARAVQRRTQRGHEVDWDDELGLLSGRYRLAPEDGEVWMKGLDAAAEQLRRANADLGYSASFADALVVLAESYLAHGPAARAGGDRYLAMVNVDADVLAFDTREECAIHHGPALGAETARRLTCDCSAALVIRNSAGAVLDVGRKTRTLSRAIRRALTTRDVTCRWPGL